MYVLNAGRKRSPASGLRPRGLRPIPGSVQPLGAGALVPKQIQFSPSARVLAWTSQARTPSTPSWWAATGGSARRSPRHRPAAARSGSDFDRAGYLLVSDAALSTGQSGATSYDIARDGAVTANGPAVPIGQAAACWLAAAGGFAFTADAGSGSIGRYAVATDGALTALGSTLVENDPTAKPLDEGVARARTTCTSWQAA